MSLNTLNTPESQPIAPNELQATAPNDLRGRFFNVDEPFEVSNKEFDGEIWPLISNIWTRWNSRNHVNGDSYTVYVCRFMKHNKSSTRKQDVPSEKRRKTSVRIADQCSAKIKVTRFAVLGTVRIERFKDSPGHDHSIEDSDKLKLPNAIKTLVSGEASKPYTPPAIVTTVKELAADKGLGSIVQNLQRKNVTNIQQKHRESVNTLLIGDSDLESDIQSALKFLSANSYQVDRFYVARRSSQGFVFATSQQLEKLTRHGWLTLIDSTHCTNKHRWQLFTLYIRDNYGCWDVGAHFFVSGEDSDTVAEALKTVRRFAPHWSPRYMLPDQSSVEANGIKKTFPGIVRGEQECEIILCTVHVMRVWISKIYHVQTRNQMILAMHKTTKIGCEEIVRAAIDACPVEAVARYIERNYLPNTKGWALWARQHSPLLLQVTTTNPLESYHSELKAGTSVKYGLIGTWSLY